MFTVKVMLCWNAAQNSEHIYIHLPPIIWCGLLGTMDQRGTPGQSCPQTIICLSHYWGCWKHKPHPLLPTSQTPGASREVLFPTMSFGSVLHHFVLKNCLLHFKEIVSFFHANVATLLQQSGASFTSQFIQYHQIFLTSFGRISLTSITILHSVPEPLLHLSIIALHYEWK